MTDRVLARWICLFEAVNRISEQAEKHDIKLEEALKPIPIKKFIDELHPSVYQNLVHEKEHQI